MKHSIKTLRSALPQITYPSHLPIFEKRDVIVKAIKKHQTLVITGETGSGKSTQIPKMCLEAGQGIFGRIGITQPRRVAATSIAGQIARELKDQVGRVVGYKIRFQDKTSPHTYIKVMTDGILLAETQSDRHLNQYDTIIIDEAHERNLNIDFLLGILRQLLKKRTDLKLIITSATIDTEKFSRAFNNAPIIEVSGRMYPVEVRYRPIDSELEEQGDVTFIDAAVQAVKELRHEKKFGDILIFMPTERDIQETVELLQARDFKNTIILPLYGRLTSGEQNRIFRSFPQQKIVVATNIAETSLTIPGIKYVIDTGLARIARYSPRLRIQSLPIERISRSSADQRKGRCGRIESGVCIRLYAEDDFESRPVFTLPEILRSNLAEVILRMKSLQLADVKKFPFIDSPSKNAVKDGYAILKELGALNAKGQLTPLGRTMARLPMDPRIARMIIEAKKEKALREVLVIASALSVRDPRERPAEKQAQADQMQAGFKDPESDFLSYLRLWDAYHDTWKTLKTQNQMRKFCKKHFLSYIRMREWIDIHQEIASILADLGGYPVNKAPADYDSIHRSIVSGYLSNIAVKKEKNEYLAAQNRSVNIFPGSGIFKKGKRWIVAAEMVETSKLFARTVANIDVAWLEKLGGHLCRSSYSEPHWEKKRGEVVAYEKKTLFGLPVVEKRKVGYGRIKPDEANEIFIRSALIEGDIKQTYPFLKHNQELIASIEDLENKTRKRNLLADEEAMFQFYAERIKGFSDIRSFNKFLKEKADDQFLRMREEDLLIEEPDRDKLKQFPDRLRIGDHKLKLIYSFNPAHEEDGITLVIPQDIVHIIPHEPLEWLVPGLLEEKITVLLKGLPRSIRRNFVPIARYAKEIANELPKSHESFYTCLERHIRKRYGITITRDAWPLELPSPHLMMRFSVIDGKGKEIAGGRDLQKLSRDIPEGRKDSRWEAAQKRWERSGITAWDFGELLKKVGLDSQEADIFLFAYPGLQAEGNSVAVRLFRSPEEADKASRQGIILLYSLYFADELKHMQNALFIPKDLERLCKPFGTARKFTRSMFECVKRHLFDVKDKIIRSEAEFLHKADKLRGRIFSIGEKAKDLIQQVLKERKAAFDAIVRFASLSIKNSNANQFYQTLADDLNRLLPANFLDLYDLSRIEHLPRYLKALQLRAERAHSHLDKDQLKAQELVPHMEHLQEGRKKIGDNAPLTELTLLDDFRWMIEELKVSLFAQELRTPYPVSFTRLNKKWREIEEFLP
jgi:ATP-dependent helicase HrpA